MRVGFGSITKEKGGEIQPEFQPVPDALTILATGGLALEQRMDGVI